MKRILTLLLSATLLPSYVAAAPSHWERATLSIDVPDNAKQVIDAHCDYALSAEELGMSRTLSDDYAEIIPVKDGQIALISCNFAAYNISQLVFFIDSTQQWHHLTFASATARGIFSEPTVMNASYDENTQTLTSYNKGRGLGDMGSWEQHDIIGSNAILVRSWHKDTEGEEAFDPLHNIEQRKKYLIYEAPDRIASPAMQ